MAQLCTISKLPGIPGYRRKPVLRLAFKGLPQGLGPACLHPPPIALPTMQASGQANGPCAHHSLPMPTHSHFHHHHHLYQGPSHLSRPSFKWDLSKEPSQIPPPGNYLFCY